VLRLATKIKEILKKVNEGKTVEPEALGYGPIVVAKRTDPIYRKPDFFEKIEAALPENIAYFVNLYKNKRWVQKGYSTEKNTREREKLAGEIRLYFKKRYKLEAETYIKEMVAGVDKGLRDIESQGSEKKTASFEDVVERMFLKIKEEGISLWQVEETVKGIKDNIEKDGINFNDIENYNSGDKKFVAHVIFGDEDRTSELRNNLHLEIYLKAMELVLERMKVERGKEEGIGEFKFAQAAE
jgi:hypothetical protein